MGASLAFRSFPCSLRFFRLSSRFCFPLRLRCLLGDNFTNFIADMARLFLNLFLGC